MEDNIKIGIIIALVIVGAGIYIASWLVIKVPADIEYSRKFGSDVTMAYDQADFVGINQSVTKIWKTMNETFAGKDYNNVYNTPWFWEQIPEDSMRMQQDYLRRLVVRITAYQKTWDNAVSNGTSYLLQDWYDNSIRNLRVEMQREGGLDWVINGAWYLNFAPAAYWLPYYLLILWVILLIAIIIVLLT
jgi:hypothetical protein